jgi:predicted peptidase
MSKVLQARMGGLNYLRFEPTGFSEDKKYPIIIHFHGAGSRGDNVEILHNQSIMSYANNTGNFPFVMFLPQCSANTWFDIFEQLRTFVKTVVELPYVDKEKVYLSGVSMGGYASWQMLMSEPTIFRKALICCGGGMYWNAARIKIPVWAFHGKDDPIVFFEESEKMVNAVNRSGGNAKLTAYEGVGHNCWEKTYSNPEIYKWLLTE